MVPFPDDIVTPRLHLIAITSEMLRSEQAGEGRLGELIGCVIPVGWPHRNWEPHVYDFLRAQMANHPEQRGWHRYISVLSQEGTRTLIGSLGGFTRAARPRECEIGYGILPAYENKGYTTEAAGALLGYLRGHRGHRDYEGAAMESVIAHTYPALRGAIRVMEKCGMTFDGEGEEAGTIRYRLALRETMRAAMR